MATAVFGPGGRRLDRYFFPGMAMLFLGTVFLGFAKTYYLAGVFQAPLPNWLIHAHGAVFSSWVLLLIAQTSLVAADRVDVHRRLGLVGFGLACAMVILGTLAGTDSLRRAFGGFANDPKTFYIVPLTDMLLFGTLVFFALRARFDPPAHKRLMLVATIALMGAAIGRWPFAFIQQTPFWVTELCTYTFLAGLLAFDLWSTGNVHRVTLWASALLIVVQRVRLTLGGTSAWHAFATWAQNVARSIHGG
jgi:hypothetical protein